MGRCGYWQQNPKADRLAERKSSIQFKGMVEAATGALDHAIEIYQKQSLVYAGMIYSGYRILDRFGWDRAIGGYREHLYG